MARNPPTGAWSPEKERIADTLEVDHFGATDR